MRILNNTAHETQKSLIREFAQQVGTEVELLLYLQGYDLLGRIFKDPIELRNEKDVSIGIDFRCPLQHCLHIDYQQLNECNSVISQIIKQMVSASTPHNKLSIQMSVLDLMFHPKGKIVDEIELLFVDQNEDGASFFEQVTDTGLPSQYRFEEFIIYIHKFMDYFVKDYKPRNEQTIQKVLEDIEVFEDE